MTGNTVFSNYDMGVCIRSNNNTVSGNIIEGNGFELLGEGLYIEDGSNNAIYHNDFLNNYMQAVVVETEPGKSTGNVFNLDAPTGGNYWSDHPCVDANEDGFCDMPYEGIAGNVGVIDYLPLVRTSVVEATVVVRPDTINVKSQGGHVRVYIEVPGHDVSQIDVASVLLSTAYGSEHAELGRAVIGDFDRDGIPDLMAEFEKEDLAEILPPDVAQAEVTVTGVIGDVTFSGSGMVRIVGR